MESITWVAIAALGTMGAALITGAVIIFKHYSKYRKERDAKDTENQLKLINGQINELYGPMYILATVIKHAFAMLKLVLDKRMKEEKYNPEELLNEYLANENLAGEIDADKIVERYGPNNIKEGASDWRIWLETIFTPLRIKLRDIILNKAHLLVPYENEGKKYYEFPKCLIIFVAYASEWEGVVKKWQMGDFSQERSNLFKYPKKIQEYAEENYNRLKREQLRLMGSEGLGLIKNQTRSKK